MDLSRNIAIAGTVTTLRYDFNALFRMEEEHGVNVLDGASLKPSSKLTAVIVWGGILHSNPKVKLSEVVATLPMKEMSAYHNKAFTALNEDLPDVKTDAPAAST